MDWNSLKIFLSIARCGSLSGAAKELGVNHSTIFRRLNAFEEEIGGRLFERLNKRYEFTALGHELLELAREIESSFDDLDRKLVGKDIQPKGVVKITAPNNIAYRFLPRYITEFNQQYPDIQIELLVSNQALNMSNRQADIAVRATASPPEHLIGRQVCKLNWSVFGGQQYPSAYGLPKNIEELNNHGLIGATGAMRNLPAFGWLDKQFGSQIITRCDDLTAMSYLAQAGHGLAILPNDQQRPELTRLFEIETLEPSTLWLLMHPDLRNVERIRLVMLHLAQCFESQCFE